MDSDNTASVALLQNKGTFPQYAVQLASSMQSGDVDDGMSEGISDGREEVRWLLVCSMAWGLVSCLEYLYMMLYGWQMVEN